MSRPATRRTPVRRRRPSTLETTLFLVQLHVLGAVWGIRSLFER